MSLKTYRVEIISQFDKRLKQTIEIEALSKEIAVAKAKAQCRKGVKIGIVEEKRNNPFDF